MEVQFTALEMIAVYFGVTNATGEPAYWERERALEARLRLPEALQRELGVSYPGGGLVISDSVPPDKLTAQKITLDLTSEDVQVIAAGVQSCRLYARVLGQVAAGVRVRLAELQVKAQAAEAFAAMPESVQQAELARRAQIQGVR